jgi:hypothetical protein
MAKVESTTITTTAACDTARHAMCKGVVFTLTSVDLLDCTCTCHDDEPAEEEDGGLDAWADLLLERDLEDAHFAEGWS